MPFGQVLRLLRKETGLTQKELADVFKISESTIGMYERGQREPDFETLEMIADYFNVDMDYLTGRSDVRRLTSYDEYGNYDPVLVGERIKFRREKEKLSRRTIELCTGIPFEEYEKYENGTGGRIPRSVFSAIATMLNTFPEVLIYGTSSEIDPHTVLKIDSKTMSDLYNLVVGYQSLDEEGQAYIRRSIEMASAIYPAKKKKNKEK